MRGESPEWREGEREGGEDTLRLDNQARRGIQHPFPTQETPSSLPHQHHSYSAYPGESAEGRKAAEEVAGIHIIERERGESSNPARIPSRKTLISGRKEGGSNGNVGRLSTAVKSSP